jgi:hypothetical protein
MKHPDSFLQRVSSPGWQILGELELTVNPDADHTVGKPLEMIISPLDLPADFLNKVLKSAQDAVASAMQSDAVIKCRHTHLLVFAAEARASKGQTWGFFRIEKIDGAADIDSPNHAIEFYLYMEE